MSVEEFVGEAALADHGAEGADRDVFAWVWDDDGVAFGVSVFGMAAAFGYEVKVVVGEDGDEFLGWDFFWHGLKIRSCDGKFSHGDFGDVRDSGRVGEIFKIEFEGFLEIGEGFLLSGTEAGHIVVEALGDVVGIFAVESVMEVSHGSKSRGEVLDGKSGESKEVGETPTLPDRQAGRPCSLPLSAGFASAAVEHGVDGAGGGSAE